MYYFSTALLIDSNMFSLKNTSKARLLRFCTRLISLGEYYACILVNR
jgi:preprotein translocase subunit Sec61beta